MALDNIHNFNLLDEILRKLGRLVDSFLVQLEIGLQGHQLVTEIVPGDAGEQVEFPVGHAERVFRNTESGNIVDDAFEALDLSFCVPVEVAAYGHVPDSAVLLPEPERVAG